jgi:tRNA 2-thiouridine synthesizing protein E
VSKVKFKDVELEFDRDGFLVDPSKWSPEIAGFIAKEQEKIEELTEEHWKVIDYLREYYKKYDFAPPIRMVVKKSGISLEKIYDLFPSGPAKGACKVAGLPKPTGCV